MVLNKILDGTYNWDETTNTFEEMIDYTEDYIQQFGCSHHLKICDVNYNRDNIYIDVTESYLDRLVRHIELYLYDETCLDAQIQNMRDSNYREI